MHTFSETSKQRLATCHKDLQTLFNEVVRDFDCAVICGYRGQKEQDEAYKKGTSKLKWPRSKHNITPSEAIDVMPYPIDWKDIEKIKLFGAYVKSKARELKKVGKMENRIEWGGDWKGFKDFPHFEII